MRARRLSVVLVVLLAIFVGIAALSFGGGARPLAGESTHVQAPVRESSPRAGAAPHTDAASPATRARALERRPDARAREALRRDIVRALERRGVPTDDDAAAARSHDEPEEVNTAGMVDRIGGRPKLLQRLNADFMPLADECIEDARERMPELRGLVALDVKLLAERDIGAIVEEVAPASINEVLEPELLECLQETLLSMSLPGDAVDGLDGVVISLVTDPEPNP